MQIIPQRLRKLRRDQGLSRKALAELAEVSEKQIQRLEDPKQASSNVRGVTVTRLAKALGVDSKRLTGVSGESDSSQTVRIGSALLPGVALAYELIGRNYRVSVREIVNMAPLLFAVLAERSLAWRQAEIDKLREANARVQELGDCRTRFVSYAYQLEDDLGYEQDAIRRCDLFNDPLPADYRFEPDEEWDRNPFADYLRAVVADIAKPGVVDLETYGYQSTSGVPRVPDYCLWKEDLRSVAEPGSDALYALHAGDTGLSAIPDNLVSEAATTERHAWLEERLSAKSREWLARQAEFISTLLGPQKDLLDDDAEGER